MEAKFNSCPDEQLSCTSFLPQPRSCLLPDARGHFRQIRRSDCEAARPRCCWTRLCLLCTLGNVLRADFVAGIGIFDWRHQGTTPPVSKKPPVGASSETRACRNASAAPSSSVCVPLLPFISVAV